MKKLDIINELKHIQEVSRTTANVLTTIIRQLEKKSEPPKTRLAIKKGTGEIIRKVIPEGEDEWGNRVNTS